MHSGLDSLHATKRALAAAVVAALAVVVGAVVAMTTSEALGVAVTVVLVAAGQCWSGRRRRPDRHHPA